MVLIAAYPIGDDATAHPLSVFVVPCLLTATLGGWRPTVLVGILSTIAAVGYGVLGPLDARAVAVRVVVVGVGVVAGAIGAAAREAQAARLVELDQAVVLRAAFERALAPAPLPPPGFAAVARYRPAETHMQLGGDFLDAIGLGDGRMAVLIGDVCGHGPREAAFGAALRAGWKGIALGSGTDPGAWVEALDSSFFRDGRIDTYATLCTGYLDLRTNLARLVIAGHPPPVLLASAARPVDAMPSPPLGLGLVESWPSTTLEWRGDPLVFVTDGAFENPRQRGGPQRWGLDGLVDWLNTEHRGRTAADLADRLMERATRGRELRDDVAILVVGAAHPEMTDHDTTASARTAAGRHGGSSVPRAAMR